MHEDAPVIEMVHVFDAPRDVVFECWTRSADVGAWFAPDGFEVTSSHFEARPGRTWRVEFKGPDGPSYVESGEFLEVRAPERLVFSLTQRHGQQVGPSTTITVDFEALGPKTRVTFRQAGFTDGKTRDGHIGGWAECFRKLVARLRAGTAYEAEVRNLVTAWARAIASEDRPGILAYHAPDILMFDFPPPIVRGLAEYDKTWDFFFADKRGPIRFDLRDLAVTASADVAFASCLVHCEGTSGGIVDLRLTVGLRRVDGQWQVIHEHHSVPSTEKRFQDPQAATA